MSDQNKNASDRRSRFEAQALPHLDALYTMATRLARNPDDAHDLLQETVLRAYRFFHQFESGTNIRAWLLTIMFNNFRNGYRRSNREQPASSSEDFDYRVELESLRIDPNGSNLETHVASRTIDRKITSALEALPEEFRTAILLVDVEELSYQEVAAVLTVPVGTVKSRVSRGRAILRETLKNYARERGLIR